MELGESKEIELDIAGVGYVFQPASCQDIIFASNLLEYADLSRAKIGPLDKDSAIRHCFSKLKEIKGELKAGDEVLTVERMQALCTRIKGRYIVPIVLAWAIAVMQQNGYLDKADAKNDQASA